MKRRVLSLDGGGTKGFVQIMALIILEAATGKRIYQLFDLIIGTSVGAIIASLLSTGEFTTKEVLAMMQEDMPKVFKSRFRWPFIEPKYSKDSLKRRYNKILPNICLGSAKTKLIITSYEVTEGRLHFYKSWEAKDSLEDMYDIVDRSSAAPTFFPPVDDEYECKVFIDGGVTVTNNPAMGAFWEVKKLGWLNDSIVKCYSIGTGDSPHIIPYNKARKMKVFRQALNFLSLKFGGLARKTVSSETNRWLDSIYEKNWLFLRFNAEIPEKLDAMDKVDKKSQNYYLSIGKKLGDKILAGWSYCEK